MSPRSGRTPLLLGAGWVLDAGCWCCRCYLLAAASWMIQCAIIRWRGMEVDWQTGYPVRGSMFLKQRILVGVPWWWHCDRLGWCRDAA